MLSGVVTEAEVKAIMGELLSDAGSARRVYAVSGDDGWVVKEGRESPFSSNTVEWEVWSEIAGTSQAQVFAKCAAISEGGRYLVMERLDPDVGTRPRPATPSWLTDRKPSNLGVAADGSVKVLDYGNAGGEVGKRVEAPMRDWPSEEQSNTMADLLSKIGDNPFGLGE